MDVRLVDRGWGEELASCYRRAPSGLRVICPFVKSAGLRRVLGGEVRPDARVVTRFDLQGVAAGGGDLGPLIDVVEAGGEVRGVRGLHATIFVFGDAVAAVTSASLTRRALESSGEFGCISALPEFVAACRDYFEDLWTRGAPSASLANLTEWDQVVTDFLTSGARPGTRGRLPDHGVPAGHRDDVGVPDEVPDATGNITAAWIAEAEHGHVKFFGQAEDRVARSRSILEQVAGSGSHWACTYPRNRRPRQVDDGDVMYLARMAARPDDHLIFGRAPAQAYVDGRDDASPQDIALRPWKRGWPHYVRVHDAEFLAGTLGNGVRLSALMDELGPGSFAITRRNAIQGTGNVNPRMSLRQQPAVRLSAEGLAWMHEHFEAALRRHGRLPAEDLGRLDWPST